MVGSSILHVQAGTCSHEGLPAAAVCCVLQEEHAQEFIKERFETKLTERKVRGPGTWPQCAWLANLGLSCRAALTT